MMHEKIIKTIVFLFLISISGLVKAEQKTVYIDMDLVMNNSLGGKSISQQLNKINQINSKNFKKSEDDLRSEENKIISQKNVLSESEYKKKVSDLKEKIVDYNKNKKKIINDLNKKKITAQASLINSLTPILADYSKKNSITMIISKQNIIMGKNELDITNDILKIIDNKITKVQLK
jgi:Skp family chaperone for outer membrane proteins